MTDICRSGGAAVFIRSSLNYKVCSLNFSSADIIKLIIKLGDVSFCFILIYRLHFVTIDEFLCELNEFLETDKSKHKILLGDINIDLLKDSQCKDDYLMLCASFGLDSILNIVTRPISNTCIDHVFSGTHDSRFTIKIKDLDLYVTDHITVEITLRICDAKKVIRQFKPEIQYQINYQNLSDCLISSDWSNVFASNDPNVAYSIFIEKFINCLNKSKRPIKINRNNFKIKPWMTTTLLNLINYRNNLAKKVAKNQTNVVLKKKFNKINSKIKLLVPRAKERYFRNNFEVAADLKSKWKVVNDILNNTHRDSISISSIDVGDGNIETDPNRIVNIFNEYFIKIPYEIINGSQEKICADNIISEGLIHSNYSNLNCFLFPIYENEIVSIVSDLKTSSSCGVDGISNFLIKQIIFSIVDVLTYIFNLCLSKGVFPEKLKEGVVKPLFKKGSRLNTNNYRPITLLSTFSKIFEKLIKNRLLGFLEKINFLDRRQFGFVKNSSTEKALISFLTPLHHHLNDNLKTSALFIDISKAFDTVNHNILLAKLFEIGVRGVAFNLFKSYLQNRVQRVCINNIYSDKKSVNIGVPQGSVLGPLLFLVYCNSIFGLDLHGSIVAFADDIALLYSSSNSDSLSCALNQDMILLKKWFYVHNMVLSCKSKIMHFNVSNIIHDSTPFIYHSLLCNQACCDSLCVPIEIVNSFKYLGLLLDSQLNFKSHVANLKDKLGHALRTFFHLRKICSSEFLKSLYYALVDSHLQYGITCWGGIYLSNIRPLLTIQKGVLRVMNFLPRITPSFPLFLKYNILPLRYLYVFKVLKTYYIMSGNRLLTNCSSEPYMLRNKNRVKIPFPNKEHFKKFFSYTAPKLFSQLPQYIVEANDVKQFSRLLKGWLFTISNIELLFEVII